MNCRAILLLLAALLLILAGCGASESDTAADDDAHGGGGETTAAPATSDAPDNPSEICDAFEEPESTGGDDEPQWAAAPDIAIDESTTYRVQVSTTKGEFTMELDPGKAPIAVNNFVFLTCQEFFDNVPIHRVVPDFVFQTGDPTGTGTGGPGYTIDDEKVVGSYEPYSVSMARTPAPNSAGSQWFVALAELGLPPDYVIFGTVVEGTDVVDEIGQVETEMSPSGEQSQPVEELSVNWVRLESPA